MSRCWLWVSDWAIMVFSLHPDLNMPVSFFDRARDCLLARDPHRKVELTHALARDWVNGTLSLESLEPPDPIDDAGRPECPELVPPRDVPRRSVNTAQGRIVLAHALAHIEFNAINLALDAAYRFRGMPRDFYADWLRVADEEASHFSLLNQYLEERGHRYGDFAAHNGLWEMAQKTAHDPLVRMALVPRVLEARGLDVTPGLIDKLQAAGDEAFVDHLRIIHRDEIGHVAIGSRWFRYLCEQRGLDARETFRGLIQDYMKGTLRGPFDEVVRIQAGFTEQELADLNALELSCLLSVSMMFASVALAELPASVFWYQEKETGTAPSKMRYLVGDEFMRIDEGNESDNYVLFDATENIIYSINHNDRSVLVIEPHAWDMPEFDFDYEVTDVVMKGAPKIAGKTVQHYLVTGDDKVCTDVQYVPGLYSRRMALMHEYQQVLTGQQVRALPATPKELHTPCFLADQVYNDGGYYTRGLPVQIWHSRGYGRILVDFRDQPVAEALFTVPEDYRQFSPFSPQGNEIKD